jgi:hypothetical protein
MRRSTVSCLPLQLAFPAKSISFTPGQSQHNSVITEVKQHWVLDGRPLGNSGCCWLRKNGFYRENLTPKDMRIFAPPKIFLLGEKLPKSSGITHMVTSDGGRPLHHHLRHSRRLSNSLFNRRTTKQTFTQWPQASAL